MKIPVKVLLLAGATALSASAQDKFDALSTMILDTYAEAKANPDVVNPMMKNLPVKFEKVASRSGDFATVFVGLEDGASAADLEALGFEVVTDLKKVVLARGSMDEIRDLADYDFVKYISFGQQRYAHMANTREVTGADAVQNGTNGLPRAFTGKGVITGLFDTGIDPNHINFTDANGVSRVKRMWIFNGDDGTYTEFTDMSKVTTDSRAETHGTHTMGCMAGSWNGKGGGAVAIAVDNFKKVDASRMIANPYYGMAPGSEIAAAAGTLYDPNTITAVNLIVDYALSQQKPVVVNLSLGSNSGPHDGTDAVSQALNAMAEMGAIICVSAGNEGANNISVTEKFTADNTSFGTFIDMSRGGAAGWYDMWSSNSTPFDLTVFIRDMESGEDIYSYDFNADDSRAGVQLGANGIPNQNFSMAFSQSYIRLTKSFNTGTNNRYSVTAYASLSPNSTSNPQGTKYAIGFRVKGQPDQIVQLTTSSSIPFTSYNVEGYINGTPDFSINDMACGENVIAVGSWNGSVKWPTLAGMMDYSNQGYRNGNVSSFSSYGTLLDGRELPDLCAPGLQVISSISTYYYNNYMMGTDYEDEISAEQTFYDRKNYYYAESGTSMAAPVCAGAIATLLEANPDLNVQQIKSIIKETANNTNLGVAYPSYRWGAGKLDVLAALKYVLEYTVGINDVAADRDSNMLFTANGVNSWEIFVPNANAVTADVYSVTGAKVSSASAKGNTLVLSADNLASGVYLVNVNGSETRRVVVR